jgi:hypothetical protein
MDFENLMEQARMLQQMINSNADTSEDNKNSNTDVPEEA